MYDDTFYRTNEAGMIQSAQAILPNLINYLGWPRRVIDVGCGAGWWAVEFAKHDCEVIGIDGDWHGDHQLGERFIPHNLKHKLPTHLHGQFDTVVCLEVAEHLPKSRAQSFVQDLCNLVDGPDGYVVFSAAIPGQGGTGHINEQWPAYWAELFNQCGFSVNSDYRFTIWNDDRIENWYRQNLLIAYPARGAVDRTAPIPVVHPVLWNSRR